MWHGERGLAVLGSMSALGDGEAQVVPLSDCSTGASRHCAAVNQLLGPDGLKSKVLGLQGCVSSASRMLRVFPLFPGASVARAKKQPTLADINAEIARLERERDAIRASEVQEVVGRIKEAIAHYGLTAEDLGLGLKKRGRPAGKAADAAPAKKRAGRGAAKAAKKAAPGAPKYTNGEKTWSGHGKRPGWFVDALAAGKTAEDLLIKPAA